MPAPRFGPCSRWPRPRCLPPSVPASDRFGHTLRSSVHRSRLGRLGPLVAGTLALLPLLVAPARAAPTDAPAPAPMSAMAADEFVDSVGVNTHFAYEDTAYGQTDRVLDALSDLGVRHVRDSMPVHPTDFQIAGLSQLRGRGIDADLVVGSAQNKGPALPPVKAAVAPVLNPRVAPSVGSVEAPNEWDLKAPKQWPAE